MQEFLPRKLKFKAWDRESRLLMRLDSIACERGELIRKDHYILQFTGFLDRHREELYEMDIVLLANNRHVIRWDGDQGCWCYRGEHGVGEAVRLSRREAEQMVRICSYFESRTT